MNQKKKFNIFYFLLGIIIISFFVLKYEKPTVLALEKIAVTLSYPISIQKGTHREYQYHFSTEEYQNQFNILKGSVHHKIDEILQLKSGHILVIDISYKDYMQLNSFKNDIPVRGMSFQNKVIFSNQDFLKNRQKYNYRFHVIFTIFGLLIVLNAFPFMTGKMNTIFVIILICSILIMKFFQFGIY